MGNNAPELEVKAPADVEGGDPCSSEEVVNINTANCPVVSDHFNGTIIPDPDGKFCPVDEPVDAGRHEKESVMSVVLSLTICTGGILLDFTIPEVLALGGNSVGVIHARMTINMANDITVTTKEGADSAIPMEMSLYGYHVLVSITILIAGEVAIAVGFIPAAPLFKAHTTFDGEDNFHDEDVDGTAPILTNEAIGEDRSGAITHSVEGRHLTTR